ncbi:transcription factor bHLH91 [Vigna angularis]|nr:transcription factor bHLH91 [Vigna angularis]
MVSKSEAVMSLTSMQPQNTLGMENLAYTSSSGEDASAVAMEIIAHPQQNLYNQVNNFNPQFVQVLNNHGSCEELYCFPTHSSVLERGHHHHQFPYSTPTPDLLSLLHLPMSFENPSTNVLKLSGPMGTAHRRNVSSVSYDPFLHLQAPPPVVGNDFAFGGGGVIQCSGIANQDFGNGLVEFTQDVGKKRGGKRTNHFTSTITERQKGQWISVEILCFETTHPKTLQAPSIASEAVVEDLVTQRHCPGYAASSMPRRPISSVDNGSLQLSHPPPSSAQNTAKRYKEKGYTIDA